LFLMLQRQIPKMELLPSVVLYQSLSED
jgi:hypothetical protein